MLQYFAIAMLGMLGLFEYLPKEEAENTTDTDTGIANTDTY